MQETSSKKAQKSEATRRRLMETGHAMFATKGFAATGTEEIVAAAGVTRGALYFHFADKTALFAAVLDEAARAIAAAIEAGSADAQDALDGLRLGAAAYLDAASHPTRRRIYLVDGPSVLGLTLWHDVENRYSLPLLRAGIDAALAERPDTALDAEALTRLLSGALVEAARWLATTDNDALRLRVTTAFNNLVERMFGQG